MLSLHGISSSLRNFGPYLLGYISLTQQCFSLYTLRNICEHIKQVAVVLFAQTYEGKNSRHASNCRKTATMHCRTRQYCPRPTYSPLSDLCSSRCWANDTPSASL